MIGPRGSRHAARNDLRRTLAASRFAHWRDGYTLTDAVGEALRSLSGHPGRLAMTCVAVALGIGALVATIGFAQTGSGQVSATFASLASTRVIVQPANPNAATTKTVIPWDAEERATRLNGVVGAGTLTNVAQQVESVTSLPLADPQAVPRGRPDVVGVSPGLLEVLAGQVLQGEFINSFHDATAQRVAVVGVGAAEQLRITRTDIQQSIFINDEPYSVIGIVGGLEWHPELESAVMVPQSTARERLGLKSIAELRIEIEVGAGDVVGGQLPLALNPTDPTSLAISAPPTTGVLQTQLTGDINALFLTLAIIATAIGVLTIAVTTALSVMERRGEIGLRRALGARGGHIVKLLLAECAVTGLLGGLFGAGAGVCCVVGIAVSHQWTPILDLRLITLAALAGIVLAMAGGMVPAIRAARIEPSTALQEGT